MIEELPLAEISVLDQEILLRVMTKTCFAECWSSRSNFLSRKAAPFFCVQRKDTDESAGACTSAAGRRLCSSGDAKQDHKQEAEYLGAEFIAHLTEQEVLNGMILVSSQRSDRIDEVSISGRGLTDYIYERTMSQAMQDVEESLNADTSTYDFTKGFSLF